MLLFFLFIMVPIAELFTFVQVSGAIGFWNALGLIVLFSMVGAALVKREGVKVWRRFTEQVQAGQVPSREIADGVCLLAAGALLLVPGFLTGIIGLLLLLPPTRAVARNWLMKRQGLGGRGRARVIKATYGGPMNDPTTPSGRANVTDGSDVIEVRGELEP